MAITKQERLAAIHKEALREFDDIQKACQPDRLMALEDRRFAAVAGAQWEGALGDQFANKPQLEMNKTHLALRRIYSEYRNNRITVDFIPKDGKTGEDLADTCDGLYRADEQDSSAQEAYDNAFQEAVAGGYGAWRLRQCYEDEYDDENTKQRIKFEPIFDADTCVFYDLNAKRRDKSDATRCFVLNGMTRDAYEAEYDDPVSSWPKEITNTYFDWVTPDVVYVAEYYRIEEKTEVLRVYRGLTGEEVVKSDADFEEDPHLEASMLARGFVESRKKKVKRCEVHKYIMSGSKVLKDDGVIAGRYIPIIPVFGERDFIEGIERCQGHVRLVKDAQRLANMLRSNLAEIASMSAREKPIFTPEQVNGHANMWANDPIQEYPFLLVNAITDANGQKVASGPIAYTKAPIVPPALAALMQVVEQDMSDLLGNQQAGEQMQPNMSGKAIELIQNRIDMQAFIYMDNLAVAMKRCGEVWLSMMRDIVVEENRRMKTVDAQGGAGSVVVNEPSYDSDTDEEVVENDISAADFDVVPTVGPSSDSKRAATVRALTGMMQITQDQEMLSVLGSMALMNIEGEGMGDIRQWVRKKMVVAGVVKPTEEEQAEMDAAAQNQQPDANTLYLLASAKKQEADARKVDSEIVDTLASAAKKGAETEKTLAEVGETQAATIQTGQQVVQAAPAPDNGIAEMLGKLADAIAMMNQPKPPGPPRALAFHEDEAGNIIGASEIPQE